MTLQYQIAYVSDTVTAELHIIPYMNLTSDME